MSKTLQGHRTELNKTKNMYACMCMHVVKVVWACARDVCGLSKFFIGAL